MNRVLIVDKDRAIQVAFEQYFAGSGVEVICAAGFEEADRARAEVDLILADDFDKAVTPEQAAELRARNFSTLAPIVCMSKTRMSLEALRKLGYAGLLAKPFRGAQVKEVIDRWLPIAA